MSNETQKKKKKWQLKVQFQQEGGPKAEQIGDPQQVQAFLENHVNNAHLTQEDKIKAKGRLRQEIDKAARKAEKLVNADEEVRQKIFEILANDDPSNEALWDDILAIVIVVAVIVIFIWIIFL